MEAPRLRIDISKQLATFNLRVQMEVGAEILVLFGPSGAGKTQTLNAIAGLTTPDAGEIVLGDSTFFSAAHKGDGFNLPPRKRRVGYVFQQYALFPHLTALENVAYALWRQPSARERAQALLERMHLAQLSNRYPHELSGGQQQRVAIARALAMKPRVLLMDEPFSALDSPTRQRLHQDLITLQQEERLIVIYVTHNLADAFAVGHRLAIMREGRIEQVGVPEDVRRNPANPLVLAALGIPAQPSVRPKD
jgi:molybdate transport system ATP-binding protein